MKMGKNIKKILAVGMITALAGGALVGCTQSEVEMTNSELKQIESDAYNKGNTDGQASIDITSDNAAIEVKAHDDGYLAGKAVVDITTDNDDVILAATKAKDAEIASLKVVIADAKTAKAEVDAEDVDGYNLDELEIGATFSLTISDRQLSGLFDGEVEFDDDEYDAEEVVELVDWKVTNNYEDEYKAITYLQVPEYGINYSIVFDNELVTSEIGDNDHVDETLTFDFLGEEVEVSSWDGGDVTFTKGTVVDGMREGETKTVDGHEISLDMVADGYVFVSVDNHVEKILEGDTENINGVEVRATEIGETTSWRPGIVTLKISEDVSFEVSDGEEYEADERYEWAIDASSIGLVLTESFMSVDEDEENMAIGAGQSFVLPNGYVSIFYDGLVDEDANEYSFELGTKDGFDVVKIKGEFLNGLEDYDKVYVKINGSEFYDNDFDTLGVATLEMADTDLTLDISGTDLVFEDNNVDVDNVVMGLDLASITVGTDDLCIEEEDYLTTYGTVIKSPEDGCEDKEFEVVVPEEELTASITVAYKQ